MHLREIQTILIRTASFLTVSGLLWSQSWSVVPASLCRGFCFAFAVNGLMPYCGVHFNPAVSLGLTVCSSNITYKVALMRRVFRELTWPACTGSVCAVLVYCIGTCSFPSYPGANRMMTMPQLHNFDVSGPLEGEFFHTFAIVLAHLALIMRVNGRGFEFAPLIISVFYVLGHHNSNGTILNPATTLAFGCTGLLQSCLFPAKLEDQSWLASFRTTAPQTQAACAEAPTILFNTFAYMLAQMVAASCAVVVFLMLERSGMAMQRAKRARRQGIARSQRSLYKIKLASERG